MEIFNAKSRFGDQRTFANVTLEVLALTAEPSTYPPADSAHDFRVKENPPKE